MIEDKILKIIRLQLKDQNVTLKDDLTFAPCDSLDLIEIIMKVEEKFGIEINDDQFTEFDCGNDLVKIVEREL